MRTFALKGAISKSLTFASVLSFTVLLSGCQKPSMYSRASAQFLFDMAGGEVKLSDHSPVHLRFKGTLWRATVLKPGNTLRFEIKVYPHTRVWFGWFVQSKETTVYHHEKETPVRFNVTISDLHGHKAILYTAGALSLNDVQLPRYQKLKLPSTVKRKGVISFHYQGPPGSQLILVDPVVYRPMRFPPMIVFISVDTLRADHTSCYGYRRDTTPALKILCRDGVVFDYAVAPAPWTLPSHVSMLTGLYPMHHGVRRENHRIPVNIPTLAERLRKAGFQTIAFTGGGFLNGDYGFVRGFTFYNEVAGGVHQITSARLLFEGALEWMERFNDRPLFIFLHTYQTHDPHIVPEPRFYRGGPGISLQETIGGYPGIYRPLDSQIRQRLIDAYDSEIAFVDEHLISPMISFLKRKHRYESTMLIFTSDHGEEFFDHGGWGHGHSLYQELLRVPLVIKFPWMRFRKHRLSNPVRLVDLVPTIIRQMGLEDSDMPQLDGMDLTEVLLGRKTIHRWFADLAPNINRSRNPERFAVGQDWIKIIENGPYPNDALRFYRFPPPPGRPYEIYNLRTDPREIHDLYRAPDRNMRFRRLILDLVHIRRITRENKPKLFNLQNDLREQLRSLGYIQ